MPTEDLQARLEAVERLTRLFKVERIVYLVVTCIALVMLFTSAVVLIVKQQAGSADLVLLFG